MTDLNKAVFNEVSGGTLGSGYWDSFPYQVKPGDCLSVLALRFRVSLRHILDLNPKITNPNLIYDWDWIDMPYPDY